ncbi:DUF1688-domain-containing protein [Atractiella rhizophila]|nr:DUF1688-domain-containing protein [Atractiella rhizophila]
MSSERVTYLRSLPAVRETCSKVFEAALKGENEYWDVDLSKETDIVDFVQSLIERDYAGDYASIPPHGRWRHLIPMPGNPDPLQALIASWQSASLDAIEISRRLVDLVVVSVLVDAGAGNEWRYTVGSGGAGGEEVRIGRSEGLALASLQMFKDGMFSSRGEQEVDSEGLKALTVSKLEEGFQVSPSNPMVGLAGRSNLLIRLGSLLPASPFFSHNGTSRPGNMVDYLLSHPSTQSVPSPSSQAYSVDVLALWEVVLEGLDVWPKDREGGLSMEGRSMGDVWRCDFLSRGGSGGEVAFHKLSQWMTYSLIEVFERNLNFRFRNKQHLTGLPEYRNGGLLLDFSLLSLRPSSLPSLYKALNLPPPPKPSSAPQTEETIDLLHLPSLPASHPAIVEWRAITVIMLDRIALKMREKSGLGEELQLAQVLEGGTWKAGREIAKKKREGGGPPINILSDGTVF